MYYKYNNIKLSQKDGKLDEELNSIVLNGNTLSMKYLNESGKPSTGFNSSVFILYDRNGIEKESVIKICKYPKPDRNSDERHKRRYGRFINEIAVLNQLKESGLNSNIVEIFDDGQVEISGKQFLFYTMEKADSNLRDYLLENHQNLDFVERIRLMIQIFRGIKSLHDLDYYHRDIKADNILLFFSNTNEPIEERSFIWKIGDLGLSAHRDKDYDDIGEKIGPVGWLSPEAMNKCLTEEAKVGLDCLINQSSDIFQLGKLFWFIFQYNIPIGQLKIEDFNFNLPSNKEFLFDLIFEMLQYSKTRRKTSEELFDEIDLLSFEFGI